MTGELGLERGHLGGERRPPGPALRRSARMAAEMSVVSVPSRAFASAMLDTQRGRSACRPSACPPRGRRGQRAPRGRRRRRGREETAPEPPPSGSRLAGLLLAAPAVAEATASGRAALAELDARRRRGRPAPAAASCLRGRTSSPVVGVGDLAGAVVELELLQRRQRPVALLEQPQSLARGVVRRGATSAPAARPGTAARPRGRRRPRAAPRARRPRSSCVGDGEALRETLAARARRATS